jgi:hypothetical protein
MKNSFYTSQSHSICWKWRWLDRCKQHTNNFWYLVPEYEELELDLVAHFVYEVVSRGHKIIDPSVTRLPTIYDKLFKRWKWKTIMVRSNSIAEDGEHSFTWIHESKKIKCDTIDDLLKAIDFVKKSFYSEKAKKYRAKHKIEDRMWILIQEFVEWIDDYWYGTVHSSPPQDDGTMQIAWWEHMQNKHTGSIWVIKDVSDLFVIGGWNFSEYISEQLEKLKNIVIKLEKIYWKIAVEYVIWKDW